MQFTILILIYLLGATAAFSQKTFYSTLAGGDWDDAATWGNTCTSCSIGIHYPGPNNPVIIELAPGRSVVISGTTVRTIQGNLEVLSGTLSVSAGVEMFASRIHNNGVIQFNGVDVLFKSPVRTVVSGTGSISFRNLSIITPIEVFMDLPDITVYGQLFNSFSGTYTFSKTSTVTFRGLHDRDQYIFGRTKSAKPTITIGNMVVDRGSFKLYNESNTELTGVLTMSSGGFDADGAKGMGTFTLNSDANGDASIAPMGAGTSIAGEITFERYYDNTHKRWRNIAFPVSAVDYSEMASSFSITAGKSMASYDETVSGDVNKGWNMVSGGTLGNAMAYSAFMFDTRPITISVRGPLLCNTPAAYPNAYILPVSYTDDPLQPPSEDGWNFVVNPFASPINWNKGSNNASGWVKLNVNAVAAVWDSQNFVYRYTGVDWDGIIAQGQAFWVQTNNAYPYLRIYEDAKVSASDPTFYRQGTVVASRLLITVKDSLYSDATVVRFSNEATTGFDTEFDAYKMQNGVFNLSSLTENGLNLAANALPLESLSTGVRLNVTNINPGRYTLSFAGASSFQDADSIVLFDKFLQTSTRVLDNKLHHFSVTSDEQSKGADRFELKFQARNSFLQAPGMATVSHASLSDEVLVYPNPVEENGDIRIHLHTNSRKRTGHIVIQSSSGLHVKTVEFNRGDIVKSVDMAGIPSGVYILSISDDAGRIKKMKLVVK